jgi:hypothetical protein
MSQDLRNESIARGYRQIDIMMYTWCIRAQVYRTEISLSTSSRQVLNVLIIYLEQKYLSF